MPTVTWTRDTAAHLLRRAGFGSTTAELDQFEALGLNEAVRTLVDYESTPNTALDTLLASINFDFTRFRDVQFWWILRMLYTARPLEEKMVYFWHDHFATSAAKVDNYDNVFPTGQLVPVTGQFDLRNGQALGKNFYDDNWSHLDWKDGVVTVNITDPAAKYGVRIEGVSPEIKTIQAYAPPAKNFVAVEDQYNFADPFGKEWNGMDTGMVTLKPGQSTKWHVRLKVFVP